MTSGKMNCSQESLVADAARLGRWNDSLQAHAAACVNCRDLVHAVRAMQSLAISPAPEPSMSKATRICCLALLEQKQKETARARRWLRAVEYATSLLLVLGTVGWLAWSWPELQVQLTARQSSLWPELWRAAWFLAERMPMLAFLPALSVLLLLAGAAVLLAQPLLAED
jgi:hypothetical protein